MNRRNVLKYFEEREGTSGRRINEGIEQYRKA